MVDGGGVGGSGGWVGGRGMFNLISSFLSSRSSLRAILNVVGLSYNVIVPALFQTLGSKWSGLLSKNEYFAGGTK